MNPSPLGEIIWLRPNPEDEKDYVPVLYRLDPIKLMPAYVRHFPFLEPKSASELSQRISQRNIALTQRRIKAVGELDPKRILKCYGYRFENKPFMIVARDGEQRLSRLMYEGNLGPLERLKLLYEIGKTIQYLHSRSPPVAHGAVHPKYILISKLDSAVLSDFGLHNVWRLLEPDTSAQESSGLGTQYGRLGPSEKLGYTAPEYILNDAGEMSPPADIYAFASVILAFLSGRHPHERVLPWSEKGVAAITQGVPPDPEDHPDLPEDDSLWLLLQRMWSQNPADRPTINQVMKRLEQELRMRA